MAVVRGAIHLAARSCHLNTVKGLVEQVENDSDNVSLELQPVFSVFVHVFPSHLSALSFGALPTLTPSRWISDAIALEIPLLQDEVLRLINDEDHQGITPLFLARQKCAPPPPLPFNIRHSITPPPCLPLKQI